MCVDVCVCVCMCVCVRARALTESLTLNRIISRMSRTSGAKYSLDTKERQQTVSAQTRTKYTHTNPHHIYLDTEGGQ